MTAVNVDHVGTDDSESFQRKHVPNITLHSITQDTFHYLHSPSDTLGTIDPTDYYDSYRLAAAFLAVLDTQPVTAATSPPSR